ncbi:hypothetical protein CORC01_02470 [Colletotrichum orchidophilum]|uniref:Uncharacterized protein n=1 Tax=Colletotrichum orchidophilum TaxID=1209926 RepID=A0A1G4BL42_9PEZI|nr:uncharacterized protein CORC01_02470 [Colletotrichum orchidophilum]OHF02190.1 hypothetical protein CORC01_02470 [Colletotrichum orchidophilum]
MESKTSLSPFGDDRRSLNQSPSPSALRALTSSRLSLGRARRDSCSTSSTSVSSSRSSIDSTTSPSCVTRTVSPDQCALHRFIVWAAVQRNKSQKMTAADRLECPMLRCRKRFPDHAAMLEHLYDCPQLRTGEYWCYECGKAEKFTDGNCKRCLGHPGKRRKIMNVAKSFFSSLGQKSRNHQSLPDFRLDNVSQVAMAPPPSYDSLHVQPQQVELSSSSEILEIDSVEVPWPTPMNTNHNTVDTQPHASTGLVQTALHQHVSIMPDLSFNWPLQNNMNMNENTMGKVDRPSLSLHTYDLGHSRKQHQLTTRTKNLSPSNSLRSNASTDTTASYLVSPASAFSGAWTTAETTITSPTSDGGSGGFLSRGCSSASRYSNSSLQPHDFISELPADDIPLEPLPTTLPAVDYDQQAPLLEIPIPVSPLSEAADAPAQQKFDPRALANFSEETSFVRVIGADSLVASAWDTLKTHISSSLEKLQHFSQNPVVAQLRNLSPRQVAERGLAALKGMSEGRHPATSIDTLCFVHLTYSLSLIILEDGARDRSRELFAQTSIYSQALPEWEQSDYLRVASAIWQPLGLSPGELDGFLLEQPEESVSQSSSLKGKERAYAPSTSRLGQDRMLEVAHFFLDELNYASLPSADLQSGEFFCSMLWKQHFEDEAPLNGALAASFKEIRSKINHDFLHADGLNSKLRRIQKRIDDGNIRDARHAELELMQAGKGCVSLQKYFDKYVPEVRAQIETLYSNPMIGVTTRTSYYAFAIDLMESIIRRICEKERTKHAAQAPSKMASEVTLDEFMRMTTTLGETTWEDFLPTTTETPPMPTPVPDGYMEVDSNGLPDPLAVFYDGITAGPAFPTPPPSKTLPINVPDESAAEVREDHPSHLGLKVEAEANKCCDICGYRPKGDPQWFKGSMAKHKKLQHSKAPPKIYKCPYPGCTSQYKNRPDNLKQHQQDKGHFVDGGETERRPSKRKKRDE